MRELKVCQRKCAGDGCIFEFDRCYSQAWAEDGPALCPLYTVDGDHRTYGNHQNPCYESHFWYCVRKMAACPGDDPANVQGICERQCDNDSCIFEMDTCYNEATSDPATCPFGPGNHQNPCYESHFWRCLANVASCGARDRNVASSLQSAVARLDVTLQPIDVPPAVAPVLALLLGALVLVRGDGVRRRRRLL